MDNHLLGRSTALFTLAAACSSEGGGAASAAPTTSTAAAASSVAPMAATAASSAPAASPPVADGKPAPVKFAREASVVGEKCARKTRVEFTGDDSFEKANPPSSRELSFEVVEVKEGAPQKERVTFTVLDDGTVRDLAKPAELLETTWTVSLMDGKVQTSREDGKPVSPDAKAWFVENWPLGKKDEVSAALEGKSLSPGDEIPELAEAFAGDETDDEARRIVSKKIVFTGVEDGRAKVEYELDIEVKGKDYRAKFQPKGTLWLSIPGGRTLRVTETTKLGAETDHVMAMTVKRTEETSCTRP